MIDQAAAPTETTETRPERVWESGALYRKAVIPTDNSELCHAGIDWGIEFARMWGTTLIGNHVYAARLHDDRFRQLEVGLPARFQTEKELARQRNIHDKLIETGLILISDSFLDVLNKRGEAHDLQIERKLMEGIHFEQLEVAATRVALEFGAEDAAVGELRQQSVEVVVGATHVGKRDADAVRAVAEIRWMDAQAAPRHCPRDGAVAIAKAVDEIVIRRTSGHVLLCDHGESRVVQTQPFGFHLLSVAGPHALLAERVVERLRVGRLDEDAIELGKGNRGDVVEAVDVETARMRYRSGSQECRESRFVLQDFQRLARAAAATPTRALRAERDVRDPQRRIVGAGNENRLVQPRRLQGAQTVRIDATMPGRGTGQRAKPARARSEVVLGAGDISRNAGLRQRA